MIKFFKKKEKVRKRYQKKIARQVLWSKNRKRVVRKLGKVSAKIANIAKNFNHHVSKKIVNSIADVIVLEDLKLKNMTKSAAGTQENPGKNVAAKSGLNRSLLSRNLGQQFEFIKYKGIRKGKLILKVNPRASSMECHKCEHSDSGNRRSQELFSCLRCGHTENADIQASKVIAKRGYFDFVSGNVEFLDQSKKKVKTARGTRVKACGEEIVNRLKSAPGTELRQEL